jgi:hypothetical protein
VEYLRDCALQAGWDARRIDIEDLGWDGARFVDLEKLRSPPSSSSIPGNGWCARSSAST